MKLITDYKPMNLYTWDKSGTGKNIRHLFTPKEAEIWDKAFPYQDKRDNVGHAEHVVYFAFKLLEYVRAERKIVVPAATLHDTGWSLLFSDSEWSRQLPGGPLQRYDPLSDDFKNNDPLYRGLHQKAGVEISQIILEEVGYPKEYIPTILEIVSQHDTRKGFFCPEDGVVMDTDKLWRFTLRLMQMHYFKEKTPEELRQMRLRDLKQPSFFYSDISKHIARVELEQTMKHL